MGFQAGDLISKRGFSKLPRSLGKARQQQLQLRPLLLMFVLQTLMRMLMLMLEHLVAQASVA